MKNVKANPVFSKFARALRQGELYIVETLETHLSQSNVPNKNPGETRNRYVLVIEVVSTKERDDYHKKFADYEEMGIPEYWIADYAALGGRDFLGNPKEPALFVCELVDGEYVRTLFRGNNPIVSPTFPQPKLTAQQIFDAAL